MVHGLCSLQPPAQINSQQLVVSGQKAYGQWSIPPAFFSNQSSLPFFKKKSRSDLPRDYFT